MVNLASRLEGLTKMYHQPILVSESVHYKIKDSFPCREMGRIAVKGKTQGVRVYTVRRKLSPAEAQTWGLHEKALGRFYAGDFGGSISDFRRLLDLAPDDYPATHFIERAEAFQKAPPPEGWDGVEVLTEK
jgi:hypothetical protein